MCVGEAPGNIRGDLLFGWSRKAKTQGSVLTKTYIMAPYCVVRKACTTGFYVFVKNSQKEFWGKVYVWESLSLKCPTSFHWAQLLFDQVDRDACGGVVVSPAFCIFDTTSISLSAKISKLVGIQCLWLDSQMAKIMRILSTEDSEKGTGFLKRQEAVA